LSFCLSKYLMKHSTASIQAGLHSDPEKCHLFSIDMLKTSA
jgi:hypothetical protein